MPAPSPIKQLSMPRLSGARLDNFSLYSAKKSIKVTFTKGAFCLAGANGLGKSTFLAAVNFGLTGIVADPNRKFESVSEYYDHSLGFAEEFFDGRVEEKDRDRAQISLDAFCFLQQFVFTFDERRHLLFWDEDVLDQALHLCFGLDPKDADRADTLRREKERADSRVRNLQWDATELRKKVEH